MGKDYGETTAYSRDVGFDTYIIYDGSDRIEYVCSCSPGILTSQPKWCIFKLSYVGATDRILKKRYADSSDAFDKIADNYSSYNYGDI